MNTKTASPTPLLTLSAAWLLTGLPLLWGVWQTIHKALALFH